MSQNGIESNIPIPPDDITTTLFSLDFNNINGNSSPISQLLNEEVSKVLTDIDAIDSSVLDIVGIQMEKISKLYEETMNSTQRLFKALVELKNEQVSQVSKKKDQTIQKFQKIEATIGFISKLE